MQGKLTIIFLLGFVVKLTHSKKRLYLLRLHRGNDGHLEVRHPSIKCVSS